MSKPPFIVAAICLLSACSHTRTITTKDGTATVETKGGNDPSFHVAGKDGTTADINTGKPITDYPGDAPLYPGKSVMDIKAEQKHARTVMVQSPDSVDKITAFYKSELDSKGWKTDTTIQSAQANVFVASKGGRKLMVSIGSEGKMQNITQQLGDQ